MNKRQTRNAIYSRRAKIFFESDLATCNHICQELDADCVPNPRACAFMAYMIWIEHARIRESGRVLNSRHESSPGGNCGAHIAIQEMTGRSLLAALRLLARRMASVPSKDLWMCDVLLVPPCGEWSGSVGVRTNPSRVREHFHSASERDLLIIGAADDGREAA